MTLYLQTEQKDFLYKTYYKTNEKNESAALNTIPKDSNTLRICLYDINEYLCSNNTNTKIATIIDTINKIDCDILLLHNYVPYLYIDEDKTITSLDHFDANINKEYIIKSEYKNKLEYFKGSAIYSNLNLKLNTDNLVFDFMDYIYTQITYKDIDINILNCNIYSEIDHQVFNDFISKFKNLILMGKGIIGSRITDLTFNYNEKLYRRINDKEINFIYISNELFKSISSKTNVVEPDTIEPYIIDLIFNEMSITTILNEKFTDWLTLIDLYLLNLKDIGYISDIYLYGEAAYRYYYKINQIPEYYNIYSYDITICIEDFNLINKYIKKLKENIIENMNNIIFNSLEIITEELSIDKDIDNKNEKLNDKIYLKIIIDPLFYKISLYVQINNILYNIINFVFIINKYCNIVYNITTNDLIDVIISDIILTNIKILKIEKIFDILIYSIIKILVKTDKTIMIKIDKLYLILINLISNYNEEKKELYNELIVCINEYIYKKKKNSRDNIYNNIYIIYTKFKHPKIEDNIITNMIDYFYFYDDRNKLDGDYQDIYLILTQNSYPSCLKYKTSEEINNIISDEFTHIKQIITGNIQLYQFPRILYDLYNIYCYFLHKINLPLIDISANTYETFKINSKTYEDDENCKHLCAIINKFILHDVKQVLDINKSILMNECYYYMLLDNIISELEKINLNLLGFIKSEIVIINIRKIIKYKNLLKIILKYQLNINPIREEPFNKDDMLLYRGTSTINEIPRGKINLTKSWPISLSTSLLNGILNDESASTFWYRVKHYNPKDVIFNFQEPSTAPNHIYTDVGNVGIIIVEKKHQNTETDIIFIPPLHPLLQIHVRQSEVWHGRLKISFPNQTGFFNSLQNINVSEYTYDYLKTTKNIDQVSEEYREKENIYFNKYMKYKNKYNNLKNIV